MSFKIPANSAFYYLSNQYSCINWEHFGGNEGAAQEAYSVQKVTDSMLPAKQGFSPL